MMSPFAVLRFWNRAGSSDIEINANGCPEKKAELRLMAISWMKMCGLS